MKSFIPRLLVASSIVLCSVVAYESGFKQGWDKGANDLFTATTDTIIAICKKQMESDTTITKLILINPDTTTFYLSRKTVYTK
jgi:hypothetical protein